MDGAGPDTTDSGAFKALPDWGERPGLSSSFLAFLFADIRGYTAYTGAHGPAAAAQLASAFAGLAAAAISDHAGLLVGRWGDEVLAEFSSAREAVAAALDLQHACRAWTVAHPDQPLASGVGLDVGEPVTADQVRASEALNLAARLCAAAAPGEVLASRELMHLAGVRHDVQAHPRRLQLKGIHGRTEALSVQPAQPDEELDALFRAVLRDQPAARHRRRQRRQKALIAALLVAALVAGTGAWWLAHRPSGVGAATIPPQTVGAIDVNTWRLTNAPPVGASTDAIAASPNGRYVWVAEPANNAVVLIDAKTRSPVQTIPDPNDPVALLVRGAFLWVVDGSTARVVEYSASTFQQVRPYRVGNLPSAIAYGFGAFWVTNEGDGTLTRIDPSGQEKTIDVGTSPAAVTAGDRAVWVANHADDTVTRIDPKTLQPEALIHVGAGPAGMLATPSGVWVADSLDATLTRIDPHAPDATPAVITVGQIPTAVTGGAGAIWVSDTGDGTIARIDPGTGQITRRYVGISPHGIALTGSTLWVAGAPFASPAHRGGTLAIADAGGIVDSIDPARAYTGAVDHSVLRLVYDGLVGFNRAPGVPGNQLVPDLAVRLPEPQDNGTTYTFVLRSGIRYSNGTRLRPEDIRRGVERLWTAGYGDGWPPFGYYRGIVGARACTPRRCDLRRGIETHDAARTVTFHLVRPDPDFVAELAIAAFAVAVPAAAPAHGVTTTPIPGTGPYRISKVVLHKGTDPLDGSVTLVRNLWFKQWSLAAQPAGYPNQISVLWKPSKTASLSAFRRHAADVIFPTQQQVTALSSSERVRLRSIAQPGTTNVNLVPVAPPFNNPIARHAAAYALAGDPVMARIYAGQPRCTWVPPHYPGYSPGCPYYPRDLVTARRLVVRSGTQGAVVNVYTGNYHPQLDASRELVRVFRRIGYRARLHKERSFNAYYYNRRTHPLNADITGWAPDFFAASQFYEHLFDCHQVGSANFGSCNRAIDAVAAHALRLQLSDPGAAQRTWQRVYRMLLADARIVPFAAWPPTPTLLSDRTGNFIPIVTNYGMPNFDQLWVR